MTNAFSNKGTNLSMTAQMLVGKTPPFAGVATPTHGLYLFEDCQNLTPPQWVMVPTLLEHHQEGGRVVWVSSSDQTLEDGMLMVTAMVEKIPQVIAAASHSFRKPMDGDLDLTTDINLTS